MLTAIIHIPDLLRVTRKGLLVFLIGTIGIVIGGPLALKIVGLFSPELLQQQGADAAWRGLVCITGSWINGTPGQLSMKEVYGSKRRIIFNIAGIRCYLAEYLVILFIILSQIS